MVPPPFSIASSAIFGKFGQRNPNKVVRWAQIKVLENNCMAIAHICLNCAKDLARQPAIIDPLYSLPLVICPDCNKASVRRPNHYSAKYKSLLRIFTVFTTLLVQALFIIALVGASVGWVFLIGDIVISMTDAEHTQLSNTNVIVAFALTSIATGAWLTAGLSHIPKLKAWIGWSVLLVIVTAIASTIYLLSELNGAPNLALAAILVVLIIIVTSPAIIAIMLFATAGIPLGNFFLRMHRIFVRERWQWRKRRRILGHAM